MVVHVLCRCKHPGSRSGVQEGRLRAVELVRRHRRAILFVFSLMALSAMTYGFLQRVGVDPLGALRPEPAQEP